MIDNWSIHSTTLRFEQLSTRMLESWCVKVILPFASDMGSCLLDAVSISWPGNSMRQVRYCQWLKSRKNIL